MLVNTDQDHRVEPAGTIAEPISILGEDRTVQGARRERSASSETVGWRATIAAGAAPSQSPPEAPPSSKCPAARTGDSPPSPPRHDGAC